MSSTLVEATFSCRRWSLVVPEMGIIQGIWANAIWAGVAVRASAAKRETVLQKSVGANKADDSQQASQHTQIANQHSDKSKEESNPAHRKTKWPKKL